ncbi:MAG: CCA tRNA nucleotidyltransferase [Acidobacteriaceae bacterium]
MSQPKTNPLSPAFQAAEHIVRILRDHGYQAYFAGGCVRDLLLGLTPKDYDVTTNARPSVVLDLFPQTFAVGAHFGVVLVRQTIDDQPILTEVATFRSDGAYLDGRHPSEVTFSDHPEEDVLRRDFTINGMLLDPLKLPTNHPIPPEALQAAVLDYVQGREDLHAGIIRAIGDPVLRFTEDKLRMLRAVRFAARFGYTLHPEIAIRQLAPQITQVSRERVRDELTRMLTEGHARRAFELLDQTRLLPEVLPEIDRLHGVEQPPQYHPEGDVWVHTLLLLEQLPADCSPTLAWGALLHDVGKPATFQRAPDRIRFNGHVEVGVKIAAGICRRLRFSNDETDQILALVDNHMRFAAVKEMRESTLKRFFRLPHFDEHLALHRLDCLSSHGNLSLYDFARQRFAELPPGSVRPKLLLTGRELIAAGYQPGPRFKKLLALAEDAQLEGRIHTLQEALDLVRSAESNKSSS